MELCLQTPKLNTLSFSANILFSHGYLHIHNRYCRLSTLDTYKMPSECTYYTREWMRWKGEKQCQTRQTCTIWMENDDKYTEVCIWIHSIREKSLCFLIKLDHYADTNSALYSVQFNTEIEIFKLTLCMPSADCIQISLFVFTRCLH